MPFVGQLLPVIHTKPFSSTWMPCSRSGHWRPASSLPHPLTNAPAVSNTMTGGAAIVASPGFSVRGRCSSHTLSLASIAMLEASPSFHFGGTLGHSLSTSKSGRLIDRCGALVAAALAGAGDGLTGGACADTVTITARMTNERGKYLRTESSGFRPVRAL